MEKQSCKMVSILEGSFRCLSYDLILEIFSKLPAKSLCRFKCVCKSLRSSIEDPLFIKKTKPKILMEWDVAYDGDLEIFSIDQEGVATHIQTFVFTCNIDSSKYCNGLMCYLYSESQLVLFNPTIGKLIYLPPWSQNFELAFDPISDKYKILGWKKGAGECQFGILTIEKQPSWKRLNNTLAITDLPKYASGANGSLFWVDKKEDRIISFNLASEEFGIVELPGKIDREEFKYTLFEFEGHLCLVERPNPKQMRCHLEIVNLWMLKDIPNNIWILLIKDVQLPWEGTDLDIYYYDDDWACAPVFSRNGEIMILAANEMDAYIFAYSFLNGQFRRIKVSGQNYVDMGLVKDHVENHLDLEKFVQRRAKAKRTAPYCAGYACLPNPPST